MNQNCVTCGAPLPADTHDCPYCGVRNDGDLKRLYTARVEECDFSNDICPRCEQPLRTVKMALHGASSHTVGRCRTCLGIFTSPGQLEVIVDDACQDRYEVDFRRLETILRESPSDEWPVKYIPCPRCRVYMLRQSHGVRSGVILDSCKLHGIWLDGGELGRILRWARSGGREKTRHFERARQEMGLDKNTTSAGRLPQLENWDDVLGDQG